MAAFEQVHNIVFFIFQVSVKKVEVSRPSLLIMRVAVGGKTRQGIVCKGEEEEGAQPLNEMRTVKNTCEAVICVLFEHLTADGLVFQ